MSVRGLVSCVPLLRGCCEHRESGVQVSPPGPALNPLDKYPEMKLLGHMVILSFLRTSILWYTMVSFFYIRTRLYQPIFDK